MKWFELFFRVPFNQPIYHLNCYYTEKQATAIQLTGNFSSFHPPEWKVAF